MIKWVRIKDVSKEPNATDLFARIIVELALIKALEIIYSQERAVKHYIELGGTIRLDEDGEPVIPSTRVN